MTRAGLVFGLIGATLLAGCNGGQSPFGSAPSEERSDDGQLRTSQGNGRLRVWSDPETGCQYLLRGRSSRGSITPRLKPDGLPLCKPVTRAADR